MCAGRKSYDKNEKSIAGKMHLKGTAVCVSKPRRDSRWSQHRPGVLCTRKLSFWKTKCVLLHHIILSFET